MISNDLRAQVTRLRRRVRLLLIERWSLMGAAAGCVIAAVMVLLSGRYDNLLNYWLWAGVVLFGALVGAAVGLFLRISDLALAAAADRRTGLRERLSTAVALNGISDDTTDEFGAAVMSDAVSHVSGLRSRDVFRHRFAMPHAVFGIALIALAATIIIPQLPSVQNEQRRTEVAVMKKEGAKIKKLGEDMEKQTNPDDKELRKLAQKLEKLGWKMQTGRMTKKQAMLQTRRLSDAVKQEQDRLARQNSDKKSLEQAKAEMAKATQDIAKRAADEIAKKEHIPPAEALKKVPSDKRLAELARKEGPLTAAERKELEQAVEKYTNPDSSAPIPAELSEALAKLAENKDYQKAAELMQKLAQKLNSGKNGKMSKMDKEMLKKQMEQLAKALKNTDLDKLAKQMLENAEKLSKMSPQELQKLIEQAEKMQQMAEALQKAGGT